MPEGVSTSLVNLGDITKPVDTLIKKVSRAIGGLYAPYQVKRLAKADADAAIIKAQSDIQIQDINRRAMCRWFEEEAQKQNNMEDITNKAFQHLQENADAGNMEDDWVTNFFDKSRLISDGEMQELWASLLAGEANASGTYSKRTVNSLGDFEKADAQMFSKMSGFCYLYNNHQYFPLIFDTSADIYTKEGINFESLNHLASIGLIHFNHLSGFTLERLPKRFLLYYYGIPLSLEMPQETDNAIVIGKVLLTKTGSEIARICSSKPVPGFMEYVKECWKEFLPKPLTGQNGEDSLHC